MTFDFDIPQPTPASEPYFNIGEGNFPVSTQNVDAQIWFNRGLIWTFGFNHDEAVYCFKQAVAHDSTFAMAWWGISYRIGGNYNRSWRSMEMAGLVTQLLPVAVEAIKRAQDLSDNASPLERALCNALAERYPKDLADRNFPSWDNAYANRMRDIYREHEDNLNIVSLFAESLMLVTPWALWDIHTGLPGPKSHALEAQHLLETAMKLEDPLAGTFHPAIHHLYLHLMEMSSHPELAISSADKLRNLLPDAGHLTHMPSHIDILIGDYRNALMANERAIVADNQYIALAKVDTNVAKIFRLHNAESAIYAAMFSGQSSPAFRYAKLVKSFLPREAIAPFALIAEPFFSVDIHVLVRFGRWEDIKKLELPVDQALYPYTTAITYYARGIAFAATGEVQRARCEKDGLIAAIKRIPPYWTIIPTSKCTDVAMVPLAMLEGEIAYREGNYDEAFAHLERAISLYDNLDYGEPFPWMQPPRHAYAALKLEQGNVEDAMRAYAEDLGIVNTVPRVCQHPNNVWALHGYVECLDKLGRRQESALIRPQLQIALAVADVEIGSSCFCRAVAIGNEPLADGNMVSEISNGDSCCH